MAFIDEMTVHMKAGRGGNGVVRWLHEKFKEFGGPAGGNGGRGGDVYVRAVRDVMVLAKYKTTKEFAAEIGQAGGGHSKHGANGDDIHVELPVGTIITNKSTGDVYELTEEGQEIKLLEGGNGGLGNEYFKSSTNQTPTEWTQGKHGGEADFYIEVRLIADAGFIGLPNAGKSSLLNALTRANAKIGAYQFTTLEPNLGELFGFILADIPGLIEGASEGRGLGHKFLRHVRRTRFLVHCISLEHALENEDDPASGIVAAYKTVRNEIGAFDSELAEKKEMILLTKTDVVDPSKLSDIIVAATKGLKGEMSDSTDSKVRTVSIYDIDSLKELTDVLVKELRLSSPKGSSKTGSVSDETARDMRDDAKSNRDDTEDDEQ